MTDIVVSMDTNWLYPGSVGCSLIWMHDGELAAVGIFVHTEKRRCINADRIQVETGKPEVPAQSQCKFNLTRGEQHPLLR